MFQLQTGCQVLKTLAIFEDSLLLKFICDESIHLRSDLYFFVKAFVNQALDLEKDRLDLHHKSLAFVELWHCEI